MTSYKNCLIDLNQGENKVWDLLLQGTVNRKSSFHHPTISTVSKFKINLRTLIIREVFKEKKLITFYVDMRSKKVSDLNNNKNITIHIYDENCKFQVQLYGLGSIENNTKKTQLLWTNLHSNSKKNYMSITKPGKKIVSPSGFEYYKNAGQGYINFGLLLVKINRIECLQLLRNANIKAEFIYEKNFIKKNWLVP